MLPHLAQASPDIVLPWIDRLGIPIMLLVGVWLAAKALIKWAAPRVEMVLTAYVKRQDAQAESFDKLVTKTIEIQTVTAEHIRDLNYKLPVICRLPQGACLHQEGFINGSTPPNENNEQHHPKTGPR